MAQIAVFQNYQDSNEQPAHRISRSLALSLLEDSHADREGEAIRLRPGRSLKSLKAEYRSRPNVEKSGWIPGTLPPAEVEGLIFTGIPDANALQVLEMVGEKAVLVTRRALVVMAREFCNSFEITA